MTTLKNQHLSLILIALCIYLFVSAPPPLEETRDTSKMIPIQAVLQVINDENKVARSLYTKEIVKAGKKSGLKFKEDWEDDDVFAGLLPAQFLRQTATSLEKSKVPLGLYLGSDFPINKANQFTGKQAQVFETIKKSKQPEFFYVEDIKRYTYMFADVAISEVCVSCHNEHKDTPKSNWKLHDVMGATTWTYPDEYISYETFLEMISEMRKSFSEAYTTFLEEVKTFPNPPDIGGLWPRDGYYLPSVDVFMEEINRRTSPMTLQAMSRINTKKPENHKS